MVLSALLMSRTGLKNSLHEFSEYPMAPLPPGGRCASQYNSSAEFREWLETNYDRVAAAHGRLVGPQGFEPWTNGL